MFFFQTFQSKLHYIQFHFYVFFPIVTKAITMKGLLFLEASTEAFLQKVYKNLVVQSSYVNAQMDIFLLLLSINCVTLVSFPQMTFSFIYV